MESKSKLTFSKVVERFSYGCGDFGCNIIYTAMSAFLLFYYTDYAKVSALAVGTIMMVSRVFDGISDIIMGVIVQNQDSVKQDHGFFGCVSHLQFREFCFFLYLQVGRQHRN